jgi:putative spermidine/putrescine transport system substrate-binding protein
MRTNRLVFQLLGLLTVSAFALSACGSAVPTASPAPTEAMPATQAPADTQAAPGAQPGASTPASSSNLDQLVAAAKQEGQLTVIALPHDWCNYGGAIDEFKSKYGIQVNELNPNGSSGEELQAIVANKDNKGPQAPDVIDVGLGFGPQAIQQGLIQPYKVSTWNDIPADAKDPNGYWYGDYYGVMAFEVNTDVVKNVPQDWPDLLKPDYKNQVALSGDPRSAAQAVQAVFAAGLSADGGDVANAAKSGLDFFAQLNKNGNFVPVIGKTGEVAKGETPINLTWDYLSLADADTLAGNPHIQTVVPKTGVVAGVYIQAISAYAPHPNAAKLWEEYLYSDAGQLQWLKGYCHPIRFNAMSKAGTIPQDLLAKLPPAANYANAVFPTLDQQTAYKAEITKDWDSVVGADVK